MRTQSRIDTVYVERRGKEPEPRKSEGARELQCIMSIIDTTVQRLPS